VADMTTSDEWFKIFTLGRGRGGGRPAARGPIKERGGKDFKKNGWEGVYARGIWHPKIQRTSVDRSLGGQGERGEATRARKKLIHKGWST